MGKLGKAWYIYSTTIFLGGPEKLLDCVHKLFVKYPPSVQGHDVTSAIHVKPTRGSVQDSNKATSPRHHRDTFKLFYYWQVFEWVGIYAQFK